MMNWRIRLLFPLLVLALGGCTGPKPRSSPRPFAFPQDTFAFSNELYWVYRVNPDTGATEQEWRKPRPGYAQHCFVMARAAREFFLHARFEPALPPADEAACRSLVRQIVARSARAGCPDDERIVIPGYADLREFSAAHERLLKSECGTRWGSYFQCGNWRMVFPFTRRQQAGMARQLAESLQRNRPPIVHLTDFPRLRINHAVVLMGAQDCETGIEFTVYDPNDPARPMVLRFDRVRRRFYFPANHYYAGGEVKVYEVYRGWCY